MTSPFETDVRIRWTDFDAIGHVNNAVYLTYIEEVRDAFLRTVFDELDPMYVVRKVEIEYLAEIRREVRTLSARVHATHVGRTSFSTEETLVLPDGTIAATALTTCIRWDADARSPLAITDEQRAALQASFSTS